MFRWLWRRSLWVAVVSCGCLTGCGGETGVAPGPFLPACVDTIQVMVSDGLTPTISWDGDCAIGRLTVVSGLTEYWGSETYGVNTYRSPIVYGVSPPNTAPEEPALPLVAGETYTLKLFVWVTFEPESLDVVGQIDFVPQP